MSQITVNDCVYNIHKTYEAALGIVLCFIEVRGSGEQYTMILTPEGEWKFTGTHAKALQHNEQYFSEEIIKLTGDYSICLS